MGDIIFGSSIITEGFNQGLSFGSRVPDTRFDFAKKFADAGSASRSSGNRPPIGSGSRQRPIPKTHPATLPVDIEEKTDTDEKTETETVSPEDAGQLAVPSRKTIAPLLRPRKRVQSNKHLLRNQDGTTQINIKNVDKRVPQTLTRDFVNMTRYGVANSRLNASLLS